MATAWRNGGRSMLPHATLFDIPQAGHVTLITLGLVRERSLRIAASIQLVMDGAEDVVKALGELLCIPAAVKLLA